MPTNHEHRNSSLLSSGRNFGHWLEWFSLEFPVLLEQDFHLTLRLLQFLAAGRGKLHPFFKQRQGLIERYFAVLEFLDNLVQTLKTLLKLCQRENSYFYFNA